MAKQWRVAVVGTGTVGEWHIRVLSRLASVKLVAVCDLKPERAVDALRNNEVAGANVYASQAEMLAREQIDVVHICTPSGDHMESACMAMQAGKHVICEKPLEIKLAKIDRMIATATKHKVRLAGIFQNRWNEANRAMKSAAEQGRFGTVAFAGCYTPWYRTDQYYEEGGWRGTWAMDGGGAIMNQSVHAVDLLQWIAGPVKTVSAYASSRIHPKIEVEDTLTCALTFHSGAHGVIVGTTALYPGFPVRIEVGGADGTAVSEAGLKVFKFRNALPEDEPLLERLAPGAGTGSGAASNRDLALDLHAQNIRHILEAWDAGRDADTHGDEARKAIAIIEAMYESARIGGAAVQVK